MSGTYEAEIDGNGSQDLLDVSGELDLTGSTLDIRWIDEGNVVPGTYTVANFGTKVGEFATVLKPVTGHTYTVIYNANSVDIVVSAVLPVDLLSFIGRQSGKNVQLNWTTAKAFNNDGFYIERRDKTETWQTIGFVQGRNGLHEEKYQYIH
jgi:hypothetical protein